MEQHKQTRRQMLTASAGIIGTSHEEAAMIRTDEAMEACRATSNLVYDAWNLFRSNDMKAFDLFYNEVMTGEQTQNFHPTHFIDITGSISTRKEAVMKHVSQKPGEWYSHHEKRDEFRGFQYRWDCKAAEAFVRQGFSGVI
jgi:LmbE family N-acetylglucosaminyl deacetylase